MSQKCLGVGVEYTHLPHEAETKASLTEIENKVDANQSRKRHEALLIMSTSPKSYSESSWEKIRTNKQDPLRTTSDRDQNKGTFLNNRLRTPLLDSAADRISALNY